MQRALVGLVLLGCALTALGACIPPEITLGGGAGGAGHGGTGVGAGTPLGGAGVSGGMTGGAGGSPALCVDEPCIAAGGVCTGGACVFSCNDDGSCATVTCPAGMPCRVDCVGMHTCSQNIDCSMAVSCNVQCSGANTCGDLMSTPALVACPVGGGSCDVLCQDPKACENLHALGGPQGVGIVCEAQLSCDAIQCDGTCTITCGAPSACDSVSCAGGPCELKCAGDATCSDAACTDGPCNIHCTGVHACAAARCDGACACDLDCSPGACDGANPLCVGDDMSGVGPCSSGSACTSAGDAGCNTCN